MPLYVADQQTLVLNIKDFGASGNGSSSSAADTTAIQTAINKLPSTGGTVFAPSGSYVLNAPITLPSTLTAGAKITGAGWGTIFTIANGVNDYAFKFLQAASGLMGGEFSHFKIDCNGVNQTGGGGIDANGATNCLF